MAVEPKRIKVSADTKLGPLLEEARRSTILLEKDGITYRLNAEGGDDIWRSYDPDAVRDALAATAGSWLIWILRPCSPIYIALAKKVQDPLVGHNGLHIGRRLDNQRLGRP